MSEFKVNKAAWKKRKMEFWKRLWEDLEIGYLDEDLIGLLVLLNTDEDIYTLSSCSGRILLSDSTYPWSREETSVVFKSHKPVSSDIIKDVAEKPVARRLWINVTGPILHISASNIETANKMLSLARNAGYKHSGILSMNQDKGIIVELVSGIYFSHLIKTGDKYITSTERIDVLTDIANQILLEGKKALIRLYSEIRENMPRREDQTIIDDLKKRGFKHGEYDPCKYYGFLC